MRAHTVSVLGHEQQGGNAHLELRGHVAVARGDAEDEGVELGEVGGLDDGVGGLGRGVQLLEDVLRERLGNLVDGHGAAGGLDTALHRLGDCAHIARLVHILGCEGRGNVRLAMWPYME